MSLTRRGFLGALAALVAAPAAMLAAKKSAPPIFTKELGVWSGPVIFNDLEAEPLRLHPIGTKVRQAFYANISDIEPANFELLNKAKDQGRRALLRWGEDHKCRLVGEVFFEHERGRGFLAACGRFVQE